MPFRRAAFTLVELLVVISIIATLAALLIPGVTLVKSKANDLKCSNNLRQVATGIIAWQGSHDDECPPSLLAMFDASSGLQLKGLETKLLICPRDRDKGSNSNMGRDGVALDPILSDLYESKCSYLYQCSDTVLPVSQTQSGKLGWFFNYETGSPPTPVGAQTTGPNAITAPPTWFLGKENQLAFGNASPDYTADPATKATLTGSRHGYPFPADLFPIIMCFHHNLWTVSNNKTDKKCPCVSWNGNVFWTIPFWEHNVNPAIPP